MVHKKSCAKHTILCKGMLRHNLTLTMGLLGQCLLTYSTINSPQPSQSLCLKNLLPPCNNMVYKGIKC
jgi:hypothetical protein